MTPSIPSWGKYFTREPSLSHSRTLSASQIRCFAAAQLTLQELRAVLEQVGTHRHHLQRIEDPKFDTKYSFVG